MQGPAEDPNDDVVAARRFESKQVAYFQRGDVDGLVRDLYTRDCRLDSFDFHATGPDQVARVIRRYVERASRYPSPSIESLRAGPNWIWLEVEMGPVRTYEFKLLRDGRTELELFALKQGALWEPGDLDGLEPPDSADGLQFHDRYVDYHVRGDADGLADDFFTEDARIVSARGTVTGREAIRAAFRDIFSRESGFRPGRVERVTNRPEYVWFEAGASSTLGERRVYDVMLRREGRVRLMFVGTLEGVAPVEAASR